MRAILGRYQNFHEWLLAPWFWLHKSRQVWNFCIFWTPKSPNTKFITQNFKKSITMFLKEWKRSNRTVGNHWDKEGDNQLWKHNFGRKCSFSNVHICWCKKLQSTPTVLEYSLDIVLMLFKKKSMESNTNPGHNKLLMLLTFNKQFYATRAASKTCILYSLSQDKPKISEAFMLNSPSAL